MTVFIMHFRPFLSSTHACRCQPLLPVVSDLAVAAAAAAVPGSVPPGGVSIIQVAARFLLPLAIAC